MAIINVNPTRMELKKLKVRLVTARRGHKLLKDKRDELMKKFLDIVKVNMTLRKRIEENMMKVHTGFSIAAAVTSPQVLEEALMLPKREGALKIRYQNIMSVDVPIFDFDVA